MSLQLNRSFSSLQAGESDDSIALVTPINFTKSSAQKTNFELVFFELPVELPLDDFVSYVSSGIGEL